jgi:amino acid adenylation domain-containing protein/thioester reductase-like protein
MDYFDLSNAQKRTIVTEISKPGTEAYILSFKSIFPLEDENYLKKALDTVIGYNLNLRIKKDEHMNFMQYYADENSKSFSYMDMSNKSEEEIEDFISSFSQEPFKELFDAPLYQFKLLKTEKKSIVLGRVHHLIMDGSSISIFTKNLEDCLIALKKGEKYQTPQFSYNEYVKKEKEYLSSKDAKEDEEFWLDNLEGYSKDWYSSDDLSIKRNYFYLENELTEKLNELSLIDDVRISPFVLALSAVSLYFNKSTCSDETVWNSVYHGRDFGDDFHHMLGMFVNMMPLRLDYDKNRSFKEALLYTKSVLKNGLTHGKLSFNKYVAKLQQKGIDPAMLSMYSMVSNSTDSNVEYILNNSNSEFPFHIRVNPSLSDKDGLQLLQIEYNKDCFSDMQISDMVKNIRKLLWDIADNPDKLCDEVEVETSQFYEAEKYFKDILRDNDEPTVVSSDIGGNEEDGNIKEVSLSLYAKDIKEFCKDHGIRPDNIFLASTIFSLTKFVFSKDILISILSNNQNLGRELPFAININTDKSVEEYLHIIENSLNEVQNYDYYPYAHISNKNYIIPEFLFAYESVKDEYIEKEPPKLTVYVEDNGTNFNLISQYNGAVYSKDLIETFVQSIDTILSKLMKNHEALLKDISILPYDKKGKDFQINPVEEPLLNKLFEKQVEKTKDKTALIAVDGELTYDELNRKSNRIANALIKRGVQVEDKILFMLKRDSRLIASVLGIVKAGCAFIPVDPEYPEERIKHVLADSDAKFIITKEDVPNALDVDELLQEENEENPNPDLSPENLCYLIYTSGSTGKPKGVMLTHGGITNYVSPVPENIPIHALVNKADLMISISTVSFIVFLREIFATIMNGMPVVFANEEQSINPLELVKLFKKTGADAFGATPTRLLQYLEIEEIQKTMPSCKVIIIGGETFPPQLYTILSKYTQAEIYNSYGPTEITIASHGKLINSEDITAGECLLNVTDEIMDIDANPVDHNVIGELYVAGAGVARGYWKNDELTQEKFVIHNGLRYYNTGDLAKRDSKGELYVLGRMDNQIKLRGLRIELGEIENAISEYDGVKSAFVLVKTVQDTEHLCAYFTEDKEVNIPNLKNNLINILPVYMVPSYFVKMDNFPMTPNGKTDLNNFPHPEEYNYQFEEIIAPDTDLEKDIFDMCSEILNISTFGVVTDLFQLGLTSLSVLKLVSLISEKFDVTVSVTNLMRARNIREIAKEVSISASVKKTHHKKQEFYPLTQNQLGVYFDSVKNPEKLNYNLPKCIRFRTDIDPEKLKAAILEAVEKHTYIKTRFIMIDGEIHQERRDDLKINIKIKEGTVDDKIINKFIKPFSLFDGPLIRFEIYKNPSEVCLLADFHHIILDGTSLNILFNDIGKIYDGEDVTPEERTGFDLSLDEALIEKTDLYHEAEDYFGDKVSEFDGVTVVSPDLSGNEEDGGLGELSVSLDKLDVEDFCKQNAITPNNLFLAATVLTLSKFVYNKNILISTISNGRGNPQYQNTLAMMVKTLPIAFNLDSEMTSTEYFNYIENIWLDVLKYECYPFTKVSDKYDMFPDFFYAFHGKIIEDITMNGETVERESLEYEGLKFKLGINIIEKDGKLNILSQYNNALYSKDLITIFIESIRLVIEKLMKNQDTLIQNISIVSDAEEEFKITPIEEPLLNKLFEKQVELYGDHTALIAEDGEFTYDELNKKANRIANALIRRGAKTEDRVMFILKRDSRLIAAILGIVKAGCAFIPVDPEYPEDRVNQVFEDSDANYIITKEDIPNALDIDELLLEKNDKNPEPDLSPQNLCYLIYTSGSTGKPKGVMVTHENITNYVYPDPKNCYTYGLINDGKKSVAIATVAFDLFLHEAFPALMNGVTLVFANDEESKNPLALVDLFDRTGADVFSATPSRMMQYLELDGIKRILGNCNVMTIAGEPFQPQLYPLLKEVTDADIYNVYGPTEITISCNTKLITDENITVGEPLFNVKEKIMDLDGNPMPQGVVGELYVAGCGVTKGYRNRDELNKDRYVMINGLRYYKTGDFAKENDNGELSILGRLDNQIKLRGLRIEIGEIESAISDYPGINSLAVIVREVQNNDHLCAYFTADSQIDVEDLKDSLKKRLTPYMVPTVFLQMDKLPQTLNGKTDIKALPEPTLTSEYVAPENDLEAFFAATFSEILNISDIGVTDNFFNLGGTSLLVTKITIEAMTHGYELKYGDVFAHPTARELANFITSAGDSTKKEDKYSYDDINEILKKNTIENFINGEKEEIGNILLTGATGFLGIHVLRDFLENETGKVYCLLRKGRRTNPEERLKSLLFYYFSENYEELFGSRIHLIEGDITKSSDFEKALPFAIDTVINCAANVKHFASGTQIEDINIGGVEKGVEFCKTKGCKYIQISTTSVAGESVNNFPPLDTDFDEQTLYVGQALDNKYLSSKFLAERVVLEAATKGLNAKIMRVGNLMARHSDSEFQINFETNGFINRLKAYGAIGKIPYSILGGEVELTPIDITARSIILLSKSPKECRLFHTYNNHTIYIADIIEIMNSAGLPVEGVEEDEFNTAFNEAMEDESKQEAISGLVTAVGMGKGKGRALVPVINDYTIQALYRLGYKWPLISDEYLEMFIEYLKDMSFFD